ncbi:MAG: 16S rRNA (guanine(527)-N(7))-methyltransferase RsmG [Roseburia sp.]|nr:16S rRNA (guanine(527)-N(7))-methyltransferase RsmG [Roseburia sp.]
MKNLDFFYKDLEELSISLNEKQICQFMSYYELLIEWNRVMNLTAITDFEEVCKKHFIDSLCFVKVFDDDTLQKKLSVIDIGTGAGFPGIPLKIVFPDLKITLLDSLQKRVNFLETVIEKLSLENMEVIHGRAEDFAKKGKLREKYDICVSRAVANLSTLSEYCLPYIKNNGYFISYKSEKISEEMEKAKNAIFILGGSIEKQIEFILPGSDIYRNLVVIRKIKETPALYPRKAGIPSKNPLI